jgi:SAM-dependent methyltransferase
VTKAACAVCGGELVAGSVRGADRLHGLPGEFEVAVCASCGSGRTLPVLAPEALDELYPGGYNAYGMPRRRALRLLATALFRWRYWRALRRPPLSALGSSGRVLDVGSGRGDLGVVLGERGFEVTALDPSPDACAEAARRGVAAVQGTLLDGKQRLPGGFDAVVFQHSLEHVSAPADELAAARRLLRPGGRVLISVPNFGGGQRRHFGPDWFHLDLPRHRSHFTSKGLRSLLERTGFEVARMATSTSADGLPLSLRYRVLARRGDHPGAGGLGMTAVVLLAAPLTGAVGRLLGEGDVLHAVAFLPESPPGKPDSGSTARQ